MKEKCNKLEKYMLNQIKKIDMSGCTTENFKTLQNGIETEKNYVYRNLSAKKKNKDNINNTVIENNTYNHYMTKSVPPNRKQINSESITKNENIEKQFERILKNSEHKKQLNFKEVYSRFMNFNTNKNKNIEEKKKNREEEEAKKFRKIPEISKKSKNMVRHQEEDFYQRCIKFKEEVNKKNNDLLLEKDLKIKKEEDQIMKEIKIHKLEKSKINDNISNLMTWDGKKKEKIKDLKEAFEKKNKIECTFKPKINKQKVKDNYETNKGIELTERLYTIDLEKRKFKIEKLENNYLPTFQPMTNIRSKYRRNNDNINTRSLTPDLGRKEKMICTNTVENNLNVVYNKAIGDHIMHDLFRENNFLNENDEI